MTPPRKPETMHQPVNFWMRPSDYQRAQACAKQMGISLSEFFRRGAVMMEESYAAEKLLQAALELREKRERQ